MNRLDFWTAYIGSAAMVAYAAAAISHAHEPAGAEPPVGGQAKHAEKTAECTDEQIPMSIGGDLVCLSVAAFSSGQ
jgi:hypothetical protein